MVNYPNLREALVQLAVLIRLETEYQRDVESRLDYGLMGLSRRAWLVYGRG